jgi:hypothetical protein
MPTYTVISQSTLNKTKSIAIIRYVERTSITNKRTAHEYLSRLITFETFIKENYNFSVDELTINKLFDFKNNIYELLASYVSWLSKRTDKNGHKLSPRSIKSRIITVKTFLEYFDIEINQHKFRIKVGIPKGLS